MGSVAILLQDRNSAVGVLVAFKADAESTSRTFAELEKFDVFYVDVMLEQRGCYRVQRARPIGGANVHVGKRSKEALGAFWHRFAECTCRVEFRPQILHAFFDQSVADALQACAESRQRVKHGSVV